MPRDTAATLLGGVAPGAAVLRAVDPQRSLHLHPDLQGHILAGAARWLGEESLLDWTAYYFDLPDQLSVSLRPGDRADLVVAASPGSAPALLGRVRDTLEGRPRILCLARLLPLLSGPLRESVAAELRGLADELRGLTEREDLLEHVGPSYCAAGLVDEALDILDHHDVPSRQWWLKGLTAGMSVAQAERAMRIAGREETPTATELAQRWPLARLAELDADRALELLVERQETPQDILDAVTASLLAAERAPDLEPISDDALRVSAAVIVAALRPRTSDEIVADITSLPIEFASAFLGEYLCDVIPNLPARTLQGGVIEASLAHLAALHDDYAIPAATAYFRRLATVVGPDEALRRHDPAELSNHRHQAVAVATVLAGFLAERDAPFLRQLASGLEEPWAAAAVLAVGTHSANPSVRDVFADEVRQAARREANWYRHMPAVQACLRNLANEVRPTVVRAIFGVEYVDGVASDDGSIDPWARGASQIAFAFDRDGLARLASKIEILDSGTVRNWLRAGVAAGYATLGDDAAAFRYVDSVSYTPAKFAALRNIGMQLPAARLPRWVAEIQRFFGGADDATSRVRLLAVVAHRWAELSPEQTWSAVEQVLTAWHSNRDDLLLDVLGYAPALLRLGPPDTADALRVVLDLRAAETSRARLLASITARLASYLEDGDPAVILDHAAGEEAVELRRRSTTAIGEHQSIPAAEGQALAYFHWYRYKALPVGEGQEDFDVAGELFGAMYDRDPRLVPHEIRVALLLDGESGPTELHEALNTGLHVQALYEQARAEHDLDKLNEAIAAIRAGIAGTSTATVRLHFQTLLLPLLRERSIWQEDIGDLFEAIAVAREVAENTDADDGRHQLALEQLDDFLSRRLGTDPDVVDDLIDIRERHAAALPAGLERAIVLDKLGVALRRKFESTADPELIEQSVNALRDALENSPEAEPQRVAAQNNLAEALLRRHRAFGSGNRAELDEAVNLLREAADLVPAEAPVRADLLTNLAVALDLRWQAGGVADLAAADAAARKALEVSNGAGAAGARARRVLIGVVEEWYRRTGEPQRFWEAVELIKDAAERAETPDLGAAYANLSDLFWAGFKVDGGLGRGGHWDISRGRHGSIEKLDLAVTAMRSALEQSADDDDRSGRQATLGVLLRSRFQLTQRAEDLAEAVRVGEEAVRAASSEGRHLSAQFSLADTLAVRYHAEQRADDLAAGLATFRDLTDSPLLGTELRMGCAARWGHLAYLGGEPAEGLGAYETVIKLLPRLVWRGLDAADRMRILSTWSGVAHDAAACAISADQPERALELLDQSRSMLWGQRRELRSDLSEFAARYPADAARLSALATALDQAADLDTEIVRYGSIVTSADPRDRIALAHEWDALVESLKQREGFKDFLSPRSAADLKAAASGGSVVVINVSHLRCDAIAITTEETIVIPLRDLFMDELIEHVNAFNGPQSMTRDGESRDLGWRDLEPTGGGPALDDTLGWMWRTIAEPILTALGYHDRPADGAPQPHVWWCPTGWLTFLPLHAAGLHNTRAEARPATVLDRVISSYTLNLGALSDARRHDAWTEHPFAPLVVSMVETPGAPDLKGARVETADLVNRYPGTRVLAEQDATRDAVLAALPISPWIHLACHGTQDVADPTEGRLLLYDEPLRIRDISALQLARAELAFVSACHTSRGGLSIPDEGMTVAGALQFAGYRHVIGTLWAIADNHAPEVARHVYAELDRAANRIDLADAGVALHHAVRMLRERFPNTPTIWAPYVHFGP